MSLFQLINSIDPSPTFLESLLREDCITQRHKNRIDVQPTSNDKNKELLSIVRRRSYEDFKTFKRVIRATQKNGMIITLLEQESGIIDGFETPFLELYILLRTGLHKNVCCGV